MFALYVVLLLITLHADSSLLVNMGFNTSFCGYICALRHVLTFALVFLALRRHFTVALALLTCISVCAFAPTVHLASHRHARPAHLQHVVTLGHSTHRHTGNGALLKTCQCI